MNDLTPKHARFVEEYLIDGNATQAAIRAGYSPKTADQQGSWLLRNVEVAAAIAEAEAKKKPGPKKRKKGRPSLYTEALAAELCRRLAEGETLRSVCRDEAMPDKSTVLRWLGDKAKADFRDQYAHAREMQADALFDEALEIADDVSGDWSTDKDGKRVLDHEHIQRSRLRVDTRKWAAGKLAPKRYGDKIRHTGEDGVIEHRHTHNRTVMHKTAAEVAAEVEEMFSGPPQLPAPPVPAKH